MDTQGEWVFTDPRFEDMRIVRRGSHTFNIDVRSDVPIPGYHDTGGGWYNTDCFTYYQYDGGYVDYDCALQAAADHFDYLWAEHLAEADEGLVLSEDVGKRCIGDRPPEVVCPECGEEYQTTERYADPIQDGVVRVLCGCGANLTFAYRAALKQRVRGR